MPATLLIPLSDCTLDHHALVCTVESKTLARYADLIDLCCIDRGISRNERKCSRLANGATVGLSKQSGKMAKDRHLL